MNTHIIVADIHQDVLRIREDSDNQNRVSDTRVLRRMNFDGRLDSE